MREAGRGGEQVKKASAESDETSPVPWFRGAVGGVLMGLANLVPGVSGGTMILIIGLYDAFISAVADVTRLRFSRRGVLLLGLIAGAAGLAIVSLAGPLRNLVVLQPTAMYALFIGMTLGGVPLLWRMMLPMKTGPVLMLLVGFLLMVGIAVTSAEGSQPSKEDKARIKDLVRRGEFPIKADIPLDFFGGVLGMSAMVLPGISGAYMLLLLGRYEQILGAIAVLKDYGMSLGKEGDLAALQVLVPVAIGSLLSLIGVSNLLKWLLHHRQKQTVGFLLGILLGSVVMLFPMMEFDGGIDYVLAGVLLPGGCVLTLALGRIGSSR